MSDVERIVNANHERVRWAEEYEGERIAASASPPRNDSGERIATASSKPRNDSGERRIGRIATARCVRPFGLFRWFLRGGQGSDRPTDWERRKVYRSTALGCAMFTGGASAFVGIGLSTCNLLTAGIGLLVGALFLACGAWAENMAEGADA